MEHPESKTDNSATAPTNNNALDLSGLARSVPGYTTQCTWQTREIIRQGQNKQNLNKQGQPRTQEEKKSWRNHQRKERRRKLALRVRAVHTSTENNSAMTARAETVTTSGAADPVIAGPSGAAAAASKPSAERPSVGGPRGRAPAGEASTSGPQPRKEDKRWKQRKSGATKTKKTRKEVEARPRPVSKAVGGASAKKPAPVKPATAKRVRPNETLSPKGDAKRAKVGSTGKSLPVSYADAAQAHLLVAIRTTPPTDLSVEQTNTVLMGVWHSIDASLASAVQNNTELPNINFKGKPFHSDGVLKMWCGDDETRKWLDDTVRSLPSPVPGTRLEMVSQKELVPRVKAAVFLPCIEETSLNIIELRLRAANRWLNVGSWAIHKCEYQETPNQGHFLMMGIPQTEVDLILKHDRRISYGVGAAYIRFFGPSGLQDTPPKPSHPAGAKTAPDGDHSVTGGNTRNTGGPSGWSVRVPATCESGAAGVESPARASTPDVWAQRLTDEPHSDSGSEGNIHLHSPDAAN